MPGSLRELPKKRIGAGVLMVDESFRILLVEPTYKDTWEVPGGMVELEEAPRAAAKRECLEELGLDVQIGRLLVIDWVSQGRTPGDGIMLMYEAAIIDSAKIILPADELKSWEWCDTNSVMARVQDFQARRIIAALNALREGTFAELENGHHT